MSAKKPAGDGNGRAKSAGGARSTSGSKPARGAANSAGAKPPKAPAGAQPARGVAATGGAKSAKGARSPASTVRSAAAQPARAETTAVPAEIGHAVIGLGLMGRTHLRALEHARATGVPCRLVAVADQDAKRLDGRAPGGGNLQAGREGEPLFDPSVVKTTTDARALLADPSVHSVSICTHTDTHVELALAALAAGKHVLVEKPIALDPRAVKKLADAARKAGRIAMPAMCMRFWPGWSWLKSRVEDGELGALESVVFQRLASPPAWATHFYRDAKRSGGALVDLHIHDADLVQWLFGAPDSVASTGDLDHVTTLYRYQKGPRHVVAEGGWDHASGFPFRMRFVAVFAKGTAEYDAARAEPLHLHRNGITTPVDITNGDGYQGEMRHFLASVLRGETSTSPSMDEAAQVAELLVRERAALGAG
ncbi:MAG: Gfo/Idh/MocA family oxidoreductase [Planctomycetes bacterium]|nr:Gfo/Idh/MocA family oxidoreductase [Planctomycetota bacterium]